MAGPLWPSSPHISVRARRRYLTCCRAPSIICFATQKRVRMQPNQSHRDQVLAALATPLEDQPVAFSSHSWWGGHGPTH